MQKKLLFYFGCALIVGGALALAWYGRLQWVTSRTQRAQSRLLDGLRRAGRTHPAVDLFHARS